jgi:hypothetical protein
MILLCEAVGIEICRVDVPVDEHRGTYVDLALLCSAVSQIYDIPMDVPLVGVSDPLLYVVQESDLPITLTVI